MTKTNWRADAESGVDVALAACSLMLGLFSLNTLVAVGYFNYTRLPWFDAWEHWILYLRSGESWTFLFSQYHEHRIPVSRLLYLLDQHWFNGDTRSLLWCTFLAQFGSALVVYRLASSTRALSVVTRLYILGLVLTLTFSASQWINFTWTFQVCFVVVFSSAIAAFAALGSSVRHEAGHDVSAPWLVTAIAMALVATGSMANGLLVWPLLVLMAACLGLPKGAIGALAVAGTVAIGAYMYGYQQEGIAIADTLTKIPTIATFAMAYLGSIVDESFTAVTGAIGLDGRPYRVSVAATVGFAGVACFLRLVIAAVRDRHADAPGRLALLHCVAFLGGSAALTAIGRTQFPLEVALTSRYVTPSLLFWTCLGALAALQWSTGLRSSDPVRMRRLRTAAVLAAAFVVLPVQLPKIAYAAESERYLTEGEYAIVNNVFAPDAWRRFVGPAGVPGSMIPVVRYFRDQHLATFSQEWTHWLGDPVRVHFLLGASDSDCQGEWTSVDSTGESFTPVAVAQGWSYDRKFNRAPDRIVFVDDEFRIAGFGTAARRRPDVIARYPELTSDRLGWAAYLPAALSTEMTAFVLLGDGRSLCRLGGMHVPGHYLTAPATKAGDAIADVEASTPGGWVRDMLPPGATAPPFPAGTWSSHGQTSGTRELKFGPVKVSSGSRIGLPLTTGPHASGVRVLAIERGSHTALTTSAPPAGASTWDLWRLDIPVGAPDMLIDYIVAHDGHGEGNWVVVGAPRKLTE